jgi:hypothetical protein
MVEHVYTGWMSTPDFWRTRGFWQQGVVPSLVATAIWWFGGQVLKPMSDSIVVNLWPGVVEWIHQAGWLAFWVLLVLWLANRQASAHVVMPVLPNASMSNETSRSRPAVAKGLKIHGAQYGLNPDEQVDVSEAVRRLIRDDRIDTPVTNETMGLDPYPGIRKRLVVNYSVRGGPLQVIEVTEKGHLRIP